MMKSTLSRKIRTIFKVLATYGSMGLIRVVFQKLRFRIGKSETRESFNSFELIRCDEDFNVSISKKLGLPISYVNSSRKLYENYLEDFKSRAQSPRLQFFDSIYDLGPGASALVFILCLISTPKKIIETGVAAGFSSNVILSALEKNNHGTLVSLDITDKVGELIDADLKNRWSLEVLPPYKRLAAFNSFLERNYETTMFLHDSDHSVSWQISEFQGVMDWLPSIKYIIFDDISSGLIGYIQENYPHLEIHLIDEGRKYSGFVQIVPKNQDSP
jgi:hypothetical protein